MTKKEFKNQLKPLLDGQLHELLEDIQDKQDTFEEGSTEYDQASWCIKQVHAQISRNELNGLLAIRFDEE